MTPTGLRPSSLHVLLVSLLSLGCSDPDSSDSTNSTDSIDNIDSPNAPRCGALCGEDFCGAGESRSTCISECVAQSDDLESACVQCLIDDSQLNLRREFSDGGFCVWHPTTGWVRCEENGVNCAFSTEDQAACLEETLTPSCDLEFGEIEDCAVFCS